MSSIREILFKELDKRGVTIYQFSKETGIPKGRIYKWKEGEGSPKEIDSEIIKKWISSVGNYTNVNSIIEEDPAQYGTITMPASDRIAELKHDKEVLQDSIAANLKTILSSQDALLLVLRQVFEQTQDIKSILGSQRPGEGKKGNVG